MTDTSAKDKRGRWEVVVWDFKGEKGDWQEMEKQMFGKQVFARPYRDNGARRRILTNRPCQVPPCYTLSFYHSYLWWYLFPWIRSSIYILQAVLEGHSFFLNHLGLDCSQLKMIYMPKETFWGVKFCSPITCQIFKN